MPDQIPDIYKAAIKRYEETTKKKLDDSSVTRLITLGDLTDAIDARNNEFTAFREKRHGLFAVLSVAMRPIELLGDLAAGGASMAFPPSSLVFGAVSFLINAAKDVSAKYDAIIELMDTLKDFTVRLEVYSREQISKPLSDKLADILATLIEIFALSRKEIKGGRFLGFAKNVLMGKGSKIEGAVTKLAKLTESEDRLVGTETLTEVKQSGRTLDGVSMTVNSTSIAVTQMTGNMSQVGIGVSQLNQKFDAFMVTSDQSAAEAKEAKGRSHQERIKAVLRPSVSALDWYDKINKSRVPDTGNWIHEEALFQSWLNKEVLMLWIAGNPGAGKSYIASNIISLLREQYPQGVHHTSNVSVAYFFFKDDNPETRSFHQALRDTAYQISQNDPAYAKYIASTCDSAQEVQSLQSIWRTMFTNYFLKDNNVESSVYLVLDGMDESYADSRDQFLVLTKDLQEASDARIQIVMLGRPQLIEEFEMAADMAQVPTIYITALNNSDDIVTYIQNSIKKSASLKRAPKSLQVEIVEKLSRGAQGMFIWVDFMLKELLKKRSEGAIRTALNRAPRGLNQMIRHVLESFSFSLKDNTDAAEDLNTLLAWVTCAQRPLKLEELDALLKVKSSTGDGNWWLEGTLRIQFASFFTLTREDDLNTADLQRVRAPQDGFDIDSGNETPPNGLDDVENDTNFDSDPATTEITFCHASIGDLFRNDSEIHAVAGEDCPPIGLTYHDAKISVLKTFLEVLSSNTTSDIWARAAKLLPYMGRFWISALEEVDFAKTSTDDRILIGKAVVKLLSDDRVLTNVVGFVNFGCLCQKNVDLFAKWVTGSEIFNAIPKENQDWVLSTLENRAQLFLPYMKYVGQQWLQGLNWTAQNCAIIIYAYIRLCDNDFSWNLTWSLNTSEKVIKAAEWCGLERNALWHRRLAMALREYNECDAAILHFQKALELDPSMWLARGGEALCYIKRGTKEAYKVAVELDKITINELEAMCPDATMTEAVHKSSLHVCLERLAGSLFELDDNDESLKIYEKAFTYNNRCDKCVCSLLKLYNKAERHEDIMKFFRTLNESIVGLRYTRLSESLLKEGNFKQSEDYFSIFAQAAFITEEMPFAFEAYRKAITIARKQHKPVQAAHLELCLAELYERYGHDSERAARIWERILDTYRSIKAETEIAEAKWAASINLARHCLKRSVEVGKDTSEAERCGAILERLAKVKVGSQTTIAASESTTMLGSWYKLMGRDEEANACFRVQVKEGLRMLSDDDPTNDVEAYYDLINVLAATGDDKNVIGLFWEVFDADNKDDSADESEENRPESNDKVEGTPEQVERAEPEDNDSVEAKDDEVDNFGDKIGCDGCLQGDLRNSIDICRYCYDVGFCQDCSALLKTGNLKVNICSPKHSWWTVEPRSKKVREAKEPGKLWIDGENVTIEDLKNRLAVQWNI